MTASGPRRPILYLSRSAAIASSAALCPLSWAPWAVVKSKGCVASPAKKSRSSKGRANCARAPDRPGSAQLYAPPMEAIRLHDVAASGRMADATSLPTRETSSDATYAKPAAGPSSSMIRAPSLPRNAPMTGHPLGRIE